MSFKINKKFIPPIIRICSKCGEIDIYCVIKNDKYIYELCPRCGYEYKIGLFNIHTLKRLGYEIITKAKGETK